MKPTSKSGALALSNILLAGILWTLTPAQIKLPGGRGINLDLGGAMDRVLKPESPLSTRHDDMFVGFRALDGWNPKPTVLTEADKVGGRWALPRPGAYRMSLQSFCGRGATKGPFRGLGYGVGRFRGSEADILQRLLNRYSATNAVDQRNTQLLIWAILARVKPSTMSSEMRANLALLVEPKDVARLEGFGLDEFREAAMDKIAGRASKALGPLLQAENRFRGMMASAHVDYQAAEDLMVPMDPTMTSTVAWGRWIPTTHGYLVRYLPESYRLFNVEVVVPNTPRITRDDRGRIVRLETVPGSITEVTYDDAVAPFKVPGEPKLLAYAIKHVRLTESNEVAGKPPHVIDQDVDGCILKGTYSGKPIRSALRLDGRTDLFASLAPALYDGPKGWFERAKAGKGMYDDAKNFKEEVDRQKGVADGKATMDGILDTGHYADGIKEAATGTPVDQWKWLGQHQSRLIEGVAGMIKGVESIYGGGEKGGGSDGNGSGNGDGGGSKGGGKLGDGYYIPSDTVAVPGNPGGQLGLISGKGSR